MKSPLGTVNLASLLSIFLQIQVQLKKAPSVVYTRPLGSWRAFPLLRDFPNSKLQHSILQPFQSFSLIITLSCSCLSAQMPSPTSPYWKHQGEWAIERTHERGEKGREVKGPIQIWNTEQRETAISRENQCPPQGSAANRGLLSPAVT